jgi:esterase/lipase
MQKFIKIIKWTGIAFSLLFIVLASIYLMGPIPKAEKVDNYLLPIPDSLPGGDKPAGLKKNNEARIVWADSIGRQTEYSIVYLHGFSASPMEADPIHINIANAYACNLYLARYKGHGIDNADAFEKLSPKDLVQSAKEAIAIGKKIGKKVILMSCSTGGALALYLSANDPEIAANILFSPNIALADPNSAILTGPWGLQLGRFVMGGKYREWKPESDSVAQYWTSKYRVEGIIALKQLLNMTMKSEIFAKVKQPVFMGYYYKNEKEQDQTVSVAAMLSMFEKLGTPVDKKVKKAFPDAGVHVICSKWQSKDLKNLELSVREFMEKTLGLIAK